MATAMPIADARYLWSEVDRLKAQVAELQATERRVVGDQSYIRDYVASFVTHAQLDAALCTKISQSSVSASVEKLRSEVLDILAQKADLEALQSLQTKKLDISVYESATWDLKKLRTALEQNLNDMFAGFAHQIETQVASKVSLEDFNHIFNPDANGQKEAIETAAARISRMKDQLESLQEYVNGDRLRQHKVADLNVSVLDLTRKHNASRNAVAQLISSNDSVKEKLAALETGEAQLVSQVAAISDNLDHFQANSELEKTNRDEKHAKMALEVEKLQNVSQKMVQSLEQIQHFTRDTLLKNFDVRLKRVSNDLHRELDDLGVAQRQHVQVANGQTVKTNEKLQHNMEQIYLLDARLRTLGARIRDVNEELNTVKGPLATLATNLREENATILQEIQRSQNESRDIMLDYQELLEKEQQLLVPSSSVTPSRPASSSGASARVSSAYTSRKHKQQVFTIGRNNLPRPHTSNSAAARTPGRSSEVASAGQQQPTTNSSNQVQAMGGARAQTAGATPKKSTQLRKSSCGTGSNLPGIDSAATPTDSSRRKSLYASLNTSNNGDDGDDDDDDDDDEEPLFHFPVHSASPPRSVKHSTKVVTVNPETENIVSQCSSTQASA